MPYRYKIGIPPKRVSYPGIEIGTMGSGEKAVIPENELMFHTLVLGRTGTGKSNLLKILFNCISRDDNSNIILVDFHGTLSREIICMNYGKRLVFISPGDPKSNEFKTRLNVLKGSNLSPVMLYNIQKIFSQEDSLSSGTWGPRLQTVMTSVLREVVLKDSDSTLSDFLSTLLSKEKMNELITGIRGDTKEVLRGLVKRWENWTEYSMSTVNKLLPVLSDPEISQIVSSRIESFDLYGSLLEGGKLVVIDVSKTVHSEQQGRVVASMLLNRIWADILKNGMPHKTILMVDESQNLNSSLLSEILSEGRKFNFFIMLASQYLGQHNDELINAIMSNCGHIYAFNMSEGDSQRICKLFSDDRTRRKVMNSILMGPYHDVTHINNLNENGVSVRGFTPYPVQLNIDMKKYDDSVKESLRKYGNGPDEIVITPDTVEKSMHRQMQERFRDYLGRKSIPSELEEKTGLNRADLVYYAGSTPVMVEVELYDTTRFERSIKKACNYSNSFLIFLCAEYQGMNLYSKFKDSELLIKNLDRMKALGDKTFMDLEKISIIEERKNSYFLIKDGKYRRWKPEYALTETSFKISPDIHGSETLNIIREMRISNTHVYRFKVDSAYKTSFLNDLFI